MSSNATVHITVTRPQLHEHNSWHFTQHGHHRVAASTVNIITSSGTGTTNAYTMLAFCVTSDGFSNVTYFLRIDGTVSYNSFDKFSKGLKSSFPKILGTYSSNML